MGRAGPELIRQFLGESLVYVAVAACLALALADLALPYVNAFLDSAGRLDFAHDAAPAATAVGGFSSLACSLAPTRRSSSQHSVRA